MARDVRLSRILHALIHLDRHLGMARSEAIAKVLDTNPVVVRRMLSGLKQRGIVAAEKGHGGGWSLQKELKAITLRDIYEAIGSPPLFNIGPSADHPDCLVEQAVDKRLASTLNDAEALILQQFGQISVAELAEDFDAMFAGNQASD